MLDQILAYAVPALVMALVPYVGIGIHALVSLVRSKAKVQETGAASDMLDFFSGAAEQAVNLVAQTYANDIKARGPEAFTKSAQLESLRKAVDATKVLGAAQLPALTAMLAKSGLDLNDYLARLIEAKLGEQKQATSSPGLPAFYASPEVIAKLASEAAAKLKG